MSILLAIDFGKKGAIARFESDSLDSLEDVPCKTTIVKHARYQFKDSNPKVVIKSGKNKGERPMKLKSAAKKKIEIDFGKIIEIIRSNMPDYVVLEQVVFMRMNGGTLRKIENHGILKGILISKNIPFIEVHPMTWKKKLKITADKETSIRLAKKLFDGWDFPRDDHAEAALIGHWYLTKELMEKAA